MKRANKRPHVRTVLKLKGGLRRLSMFDLSDALDVFGSLVRGTRRREGRLAVGFEDAGSVPEIFGMVGARLGSDPKIATEKRRAKFGNHFFHRIGIIAKAFTEGSRATCLCA